MTEEQSTYWNCVLAKWTYVQNVQILKTGVYPIGTNMNPKDAPKLQAEMERCKETLTHYNHLDWITPANIGIQKTLF